MKNHIVYFWQGERSSHDARAASALQAYRWRWYHIMAHSYSNNFRIEHEISTGRRASKGVQIRVEQGRESSHFLQ